MVDPDLWIREGPAHPDPEISGRGGLGPPASAMGFTVYA